MYHVADLHAGDILLVHNAHHSLFDWLIELATNAPWDHAAYVADPSDAQHGLIEGLWRVTASPLNKYQADGVIFRPLHCPLPTISRITEWLRHRLGDPYGVTELLLDGGLDYLHLTCLQRIKVRYYTCSGLLAVAFRANGYPLTFAPFPSPADLSYSPLLTPIGYRRH